MYVYVGIETWLGFTFGKRYFRMSFTFDMSIRKTAYCHFTGSVPAHNMVGGPHQYCLALVVV